MPRPGIMIYFDILEPIKVLSDAEKGKLLVAMLEYGQTGVLPVFDGMLALAWGFVKPKLDRDEETYESSKSQRKYASFCKQRSARNLPKIPFEEWANMSQEERERAATADNEPLRAGDSVTENNRSVSVGAFRYPSTTATAPVTASTSAKTSTSVSTAAAVTANTEDFAAATADTQLKLFNGKLGKGVVMLSDEQVEDLLDKMELDCFDYYVDKLASFIIKNDAKVKNHYETMLKWWKQDRGIQ